MNLCDYNTIRPLLERHGFRFSKSMGQNFLVEAWVPRDIVDATGVDKTCGVLEIGPGIGPLTVPLAQAAGAVVSVELDRSLLPVLAETLAQSPNATVVSADILKCNIPQLVAEHLDGLTPHAAANLPYNITTPVITALLEAKVFQSITVMIQREVARRICAAPGTSDYGAFSLFCQYHAHCELLFDVAPTCFLPPPKVTSSVIRMVPRPKPAEVGDPVFFFKVVRCAFAQRRKTLLNNLVSLASGRLNKEELTALIVSCDLPADIRGERLGIPEFARLASALQTKLNSL